MSNRLVEIRKEGVIAVIEINNPPVNAINAEVLSGLTSALDWLEEQLDIRVAIITGGGDRFFVAGADINQFPSLNETTGRELVRTGQETLDRIGLLPIPVICAVNGFALGGGCEIALACDIRIASENAKFGLPEVGLGIIPGYGGTQRLPRLVGVGKAKELIFSGEPISAEEAGRIGLVEKVVPVGEVLQHAFRLAHSIISKGPIAIAMAKQAIDQGIEKTLHEGLVLEADLFARLCKTEDKNEGARAFIEKRVPQFKGN